MHGEAEHGNSSCQNEFLDPCQHAPIDQNDQQEPGRQQQDDRLVKTHGHAGQKCADIDIGRALMAMPCNGHAISATGRR